MTDDIQIEEQDDIGADIKAAMAEVAEPVEKQEVVDPVEKVETPTTETIEKTEPTPKAFTPPESLSAEAKADWEKVPESVRKDIERRESDFHKMMTRHDGELNLGRAMKDVISPYMPIIQAEGGTPEKAVRDLLNTAYVLRTASPERKAAMVQEICQTYGVDMGAFQNQQEYVDPTIQQLQREINDLRQFANPEAINKRLQEQQEAANIQAEVQAFAANPGNEHFEKVRPLMAELIGAGKAKGMQEAYDMAIWADPETRSMLLAKQTGELEAKRKAEIEAKKKAAASVSGSPSGPTGNSAIENENSIDDDVRNAYNAVMGGNKI